MKNETIRVVTLELVKMAIVELSKMEPGDPQTFSPICNAIATGMSMAIKVQLEELRHFARIFKPDTNALIEGWIVAKQMEAGLPAELPDWYRPGSD